MRVLFGFPGWGWKMYGLASFRSGNMWFVGFSKQLSKVCAGDTAGGGCDYCRNPLFAGRTCKNCGKVHWHDELHNVELRGAEPIGEASLSNEGLGIVREE